MDKYVRLIPSFRVVPSSLVINVRRNPKPRSSYHRRTTPSLPSVVMVFSVRRLVSTVGPTHQTFGERARTTAASSHPYGGLDLPGSRTPRRYAAPNSRPLLPHLGRGAKRCRCRMALVASSWKRSLSSFGGYSGERCIPHAPFLVGIAFRRQGCCHATDHPNRAVNASGPLSTNDASPGARTQLSNFATLDLLLSVAQDVAAMPAERRKAASGAAARRRLADLRESKRAADRGYGPPLTPAQEAALGYSLHRDASWGQRRQPKARSPASI